MKIKPNPPPSCREEFLRRAAKYDGEEREEFTSLLSSAIDDYGISIFEIEQRFQAFGVKYWHQGISTPVAPRRRRVVKQLADWISESRKAPIRRP